jgi:hypothetical protein
MKLKKDDYLKVVGLLALAPAHNKALADIEAALCRILGEKPNTGSHVGDAVYSNYTADTLLEKLTAERKRKGKK